ncbi:hypothetical protein FKW77_009463 [Venturia effusa]|uniref:Uncharacterized protein n=1 Tax=Venturia effusa TaxID=50376 RepID=A0A517KXB3_9PEZI|nr:hypothetical protein FKW77_009463 [Venturia effusa]
MEWLHAETEKIARESGSSAIVTTWLKTYEMNARKRQRDSSRWERWEATNGRAKLFPKIRANSTPSSPASNSSTMSKNKNRKSKNRARNNATATGANAVPTGGQTAPMSRAAFNHQGQPVLPLNSARVPPAFGSPSSIVARNAVPNSAPTTPISSFCRSGAVPFNSLSNHPLPSNNTLPVPCISKDTTGSLLDAIKAITHPIGSTARGGSFASSSAGQHAASFPQSLQQQPASTLQPLPAAQISAAAAPFIQRAQTIMPSSAAVCATMETPPVAPPIQPISACTGAAAIAPIEDAQIIAEAVRRQSSICPEEVVKIESDGPELPQLTRPTRQSPKIQTLERESLRQRERATGISRIQYLPESHYRSRSRTPPHDRKSLYRERDYFDTRHLSTYDHLVQPHAVRHVPQVLYDEYGNEYVRTGRRPNPYVLYEPPPSRGY